MNEFLIALLVILGTLILYFFSMILNRKYRSPFTQPIIAVSAIVIILLLLFDIPYETYMIGGQWIEVMMGPAVVALGIPLYNYFSMIKKLAGPILIGTFSGALVGVSTGLLLAKWFGYEEEIILAITPKSVTTPVAVSISDTLGGPPTLAAVFVVVAGVSGILMSPFIFKVFKLHTPIGVGIGLGSAAHAMGTAAAMDRGNLEASMSTIAMSLSAVITSMIAPLLIAYLL